jgi:hypothetical protein
MKYEIDDLVLRSKYEVDGSHSGVESFEIERYLWEISTPELSAP